MKIRYLGQAGFLIEGEKIRFLIDPYLSNYVVESGIGDAHYFSREFAAPLQPEELDGIQFAFITHAHADHCDPLTLIPMLRNNPNCRVIGPRAVVNQLIRCGVSEEMLVATPMHVKSRAGELAYTAIPSAHYNLDLDQETGEYPYFGFVIEVGGVVLYHSGDTVFYAGLLENLRKAAAHYDIACLPVNGRDEKREALGIVGNLQPEEAVILANSLGASVLIPMHNDLFKINHLDPGILNRYVRGQVPRQTVKWLQPGEVFQYTEMK